MNADDRANELYWGSDQSVNQIAEDLDLSKGALYEMIRPLPAGVACPLCGVEVVHSNRTARERGRVDCPACGWDGVADDAVGPSTDGEGSPPGQQAPRAPSIEGVEPVDDIYPDDDYDAPGPLPASEAGRLSSVRRLMAGGALLGAAAGLALVIWARRR